MVVRSTPTHCAGVHTVCKEGAEGYFIESVWRVCVRENAKCAVRANLSNEKVQNIGIFETKTFECVLWCFIQILRPID